MRATHWILACRWSPPIMPAETRFAVALICKIITACSGMTVTIAGRDGRAYGILGVCTGKARGISPRRTPSFLAAVANLLAGAIQRRQLEQRHELMIRDMRHRSGNLFSQLLALFSQTAKNAKSIADLPSKYQARVLAMANAHRLITEGGWKIDPDHGSALCRCWDPISIGYRSAARTSNSSPIRSSISARRCMSLPTTRSSTAACRGPRGSLDLSWSVSRTERGMTFVLDWVEKNGPPARRPRRLGFGSRLVGMVIERQLNGEVHALVHAQRACRCTWWCRSRTSAGRAPLRLQRPGKDPLKVIVGAARRRSWNDRLRMHVFREPVGRQIVAGAAFLGLAVEQRAGGGELIAEPDIVDEAGDLAIGLAAFGAAGDQVRARSAACRSRSPRRLPSRGRRLSPARRDPWSTHGSAWCRGYG